MVFGSFLNKKKKPPVTACATSAAKGMGRQKARKWIKGVGYKTVTIGGGGGEGDGDDGIQGREVTVAVDSTLQVCVCTVCVCVHCVCVCFVCVSPSPFSLLSSLRIPVRR